MPTPRIPSDSHLHHAPRTRPRRPGRYKVILLDDPFTPRDFVASVLCSVFRMTQDQARAVAASAHQDGTCLVAVFTREVAETKAGLANDAGRKMGYPLAFTTERDDQQPL